MTAHVVLALVAMSLLTARQAAGQTCWAPDRAQAPDRVVARSAPIAALDAAVARVSAALKRNTALTAIPNVRLMVTSYVGYANQGFGHAVRISAGLYPPNTWRDGCTLMAGPEFFNRGHVHVNLNGPGEIFHDVRPRLKDDVLTAYAEPTGAIAVGEETYFESIRGVVLTPGRRPAWVPVTVAEWLDYRERVAAAKVDELTAELGKQKSSVERYRTDMERQIAQAPDAATKAQLRSAMDENARILQASTAAAIGEFTKLLKEAEAVRQNVRDERARLAAPARDQQVRVDGVPLVKINPALAGGTKPVNLIVVHAVPNDRTMDAPLKQAVRAMDFSALRALID
jgi:hypothetical protein